MYFDYTDNSSADPKSKDRAHTLGRILTLHLYVILIVTTHLQLIASVLQTSKPDTKLMYKI